MLARDDEFFMREALKEARKAFEEDEVPVGALMVYNGTVIGRAHNQREKLNDPTAHAEMIAITQAAEALGSWRLTDVVCYVTLEPCLMCAGAMVNARVKRLVYATADPKAGACGSLFDIPNDKRLNHRIEVLKGICENESSQLLKEFFAGKRKRDLRSEI